MKTITTLKALILIILPLSLQTVFSQVRIVEKIDIYPQGGQLKKGNNSLDSARYKAPYSGSYLGSVFLSARDVAPPIGPLTVTFKDALRDTTIIFDLNDYIVQTTVWPCSLVLHLPCVNPPQYPVYNFYDAYSAYWESDTVSIHKCFRIPYVLKNDTLKFAYNNWTNNHSYDMGYDVEMAINDPLHGCLSYPEGCLQDLKLCGIDLAPMRFTIYKEGDTLLMGSSAVLSIVPFDSFRSACSKINDSLMTLELDSTQYAQFIYDKGTSIDTLTSPVDSIKVSDAMTGKIKFYAAGNKPDKPTPVRICARLMSDSSRVFEDTIFVKGSEILLGETKYYQAIPDPENSSKLKFKEMSETSGWVPGGQPAQFTVEAVTPTTKIGVYYEFRDSDTLALAGDMIRLVGRYWKQDTSYNVKLSASSGTRTGSIIIEVKKPAKLGDSHTSAKSVKMDPFNLDSLIIYHAGIEGVTPQYIKAMISKETMGFFDPCYRYEMWGDIEILQKKNRNGICRYAYDTSFSRYKILGATEKGDPGIPTDHSNVRDASKTRQPYPGYKTIWDYYSNHQNFYSLNIYPNGEKERFWESTCDTVSKELYCNNYDELSDVEQRTVEDSTNERFSQWIKNSYNGGTKNMIAQTRIYSSYGILQLVYYGGKEYPQNNSSYRPEDINDHSIGFKYSISHLLNKFNSDKILNNHFNDPTWQAGYNAKYKQAIKAYNGKGDKAVEYVNDVLSRVPSYLPKY